MAASGKIVLDDTRVQIRIKSGFTILTFNVDWREIGMWWRYAAGELEEGEGSFGEGGDGAVFIVPGGDHTIFQVDADGVQQTISVPTDTARRSVKRSLNKLEPKTVTIDDGATSFSLVLSPPSWGDWRDVAEGAAGETRYTGSDDILVHFRVDGGLAILTCAGETFQQKLYFLAWHARESIARSLSV
jgi:hypothetical protein